MKGLVSFETRGVHSFARLTVDGGKDFLVEVKAKTNTPEGGKAAHNALTTTLGPKYPINKPFDVADWVAFREVRNLFMGLGPVLDALYDSAHPAGNSV